MSDASHAEGPLPAVIPGDIVEDRARVVPLRAVGHGARIAAHDEHGRVAQVVGAFARGHDYRGGHIRLLTAIEQSKWLYHPSRSLMVIDGDWRTMNRLGVEARVIAMRDGDFRERLGGTAGIPQISHRGHAKALRGGGPAPAHVELVVTLRIRRRNRSCRNLPTHPPPRASIHR